MTLDELIIHLQQKSELGYGKVQIYKYEDDEIPSDINAEYFDHDGYWPESIVLQFSEIKDIMEDKD